MSADLINIDSIMGQNHDLQHEFPEYSELIDELWESDEKFAHLADDYTRLNREVIRIEKVWSPAIINIAKTLKRNVCYTKTVYTRYLNQVNTGILVRMI